MGTGHAADRAWPGSLGWVRQIREKEPLMSPLICRVKEKGAHLPRTRTDTAGSLAPHGPGPSGRRLGDLGRAALTSVGSARLLPAGSGWDTALSWVRRPTRRQALNPWGQGCLQSGNELPTAPPPRPAKPPKA